MNPIFKKLNYKSQEEIFVLNAPPAFANTITDMESLTKVSKKLRAKSKISFVVAFVTNQKQVDEVATTVVPLIDEDAVLWFAYPKKTSKKYTCDFDRDSGWAVLGNAGFEGVRMVAIDEDWSALRFRKAEHIKTMTRTFAMSDVGKKKVAASTKKTSATKKTQRGT